MKTLLLRTNHEICQIKQSAKAAISLPVWRRPQFLFVLSGLTSPCSDSRINGCTIAHLLIVARLQQTCPEVEKVILSFCNDLTCMFYQLFCPSRWQQFWDLHIPQHIRLKLIEHASICHWVASSITRSQESALRKIRWSIVCTNHTFYKPLTPLLKFCSQKQMVVIFIFCINKWSPDTCDKLGKLIHASQRYREPL
jgi:hypothetical protein